MKSETGKLLSHWTSFKIGGPAFCWLEPENLDDILKAISFAESNVLPLAIIGRGSNILAHDKGFDGVLINLGRGFDYIENEGNGIIRIGGTVSISRLVRQSIEWEAAGCEFLWGIPGSFGGAVFMNAGVSDIDEEYILREIKDIILDIDVLDLKTKRVATLKREDIAFAYRSSGLNEKCILGGRIRLEMDERSAIIRRIDSYMNKREWIQRLGFPSAGSVFKNPDSNTPAGRLIEKCGLKKKRIRGAEISDIHANFIINVDQAGSKDVLDLIEVARKGVKDRFGIELELELKLL